VERLSEGVAVVIDAGEVSGDLDAHAALAGAPVHVRCRPSTRIDVTPPATPR
jgi:hypothetical protein